MYRVFTASTKTCSVKKLDIVLQAGSLKMFLWRIKNDVKQIFTSCISFFHFPVSMREANSEASSWLTFSSSTKTLRMFILNGAFWLEGGFEKMYNI